MENSEEPYFSCGSQMLAVPMSFWSAFHSANEFPGDLAWRDVGGGTGDHFRDRHAGTVWAGYQRPPGDVRPAVAAGEDVLALQLVCIMYAGFKRIEPGMDIGVDLGEEWEMAVRLMGEA